VLIVAASAVRRSGLETIVRDGARTQSAGTLSSLEWAGKHYREILPEVILVDVARPDAAFLNDLRTLAAPTLPLVLLVDQAETAWSARALTYGVRSILARDAAPDDILLAIDTAHRGLVLLDLSLAVQIGARVRPEESEASAIPLGELTSRELEVLRLLAEGRANKEIAESLGISDHTVKFHISSILGKLGAESRTEAVTLGVRKGLIVL
jgi:DNA-binding NarL/FixJ family response regulator